MPYLLILLRFASQGRNKHLSSANERMEMELLYSRAIDMNGGLGDSDDGAGTEKGSSILRQKYERAAKDLEYAKKRLAQQHEDDMEQLMALKKQLEKKVGNVIRQTIPIAVTQEHTTLTMTLFRVPY